MERDKATVTRLTLRSTGAGETGGRRPARGRQERRQEEAERKKPPVKSLSSGSLLKEYRVEKQRPLTPTVQEELEVQMRISAEHFNRKYGLCFNLQVDVDEEQAAILLQKTLKGRSVQLRLLKGRDRKQDLIDAMMLENPITSQDAEIVSKKVFDSRRAKLEQESLQSKEDYINSFLDRLEGETLGRMLDYLSQELTDSATVV